MNYLKAYCSLIRKAENRDCPEGYVEGHHIFPKSIYGENNRIVKFTAREHYIAHALLEKIFIKRYGKKDYRSIKMIHAFYCMNTANRTNYYNSFLYESSRAKTSKLLEGNDHRRGKKLSEEHIQKIIKANTGRKHSEETKRKISESNKGKKISDEAKRKMSLAKKGKPIPPEQREKMIAAVKGKKRKNPFTEEHKKNISKSCKGRIAWNKGIPRSEEVKKKLSEKLKGRIITEETRKKMSEAHKKRSQLNKEKANE